MSDRQRVVVVTGGGGGIGAAIAESIGRTGTFVVTVDPLVSIDGSERLPEAEETTAGRIVAGGGAARASGVSVTDEPGIRELFGRLADEFGGLDAVVNVAGITRPTSFAKGTDDDWLGVLSVHLDGYRNVLAAALPLMAAAGRGHILGVTSGSGWRSADAGAYGCAKRAVAALTWQLGRHAPPGVVINAISPIAATRMVAAAMSRMQKVSGSSTGGLSLGSMPAPEHLGPLGAHLVSETFTSCHGRVLFAGGSEIAVIDEPRLIEVVRSDAASGNGGPSVAQVLEAATSIALTPAESNQVSGGGSNARFGTIFDGPATDDLPVTTVQSCAVVAEHPDVAGALSAALHVRGVTPHVIVSPAELSGLEAPDAVVVALTGGAAATAAPDGWERVLVEHTGLAEQIQADATWTRAVAELATASGRPVRLVTITDGTTAGGRSRAQAAAQLARAGRKATGDRVLPFAISAEAGPVPTELAAHLACSPNAIGVAGAELVSGAGWFGLRSHPRPIGSISFGGPAVPDWFDDTIREVVQPR